MAAMKTTSEIGKKYGRLAVIKDTGKRYHSTRIMLCRCECGNLKEVDINKLHSGHTKSCGCLNHALPDMVGKRYGRLVVLAF